MHDMMTRACVPLGVLALFSALLAPVSAQEDGDGKKAKASAIENLKKIKIDKPTILETENFVVAGTITEEKAKALGAVLEKVLPVARKGAKFDDNDKAWKGKLVVYYLPDPDEYKSFMRRVLQIAPEGIHADFRAEQAFVVDPATMPGKPTDAELFARTAARIAGEHITSKGTGTQVIPAWLRDGFGRAVVLQAEGVKSKRYQAYRTQLRSAMSTLRNGAYPTIGTAADGERSAVVELLATSVAEFLAFGPKAAEFDKFIEALRPSDGNDNPAVTTGYMALGWKDEAAADAAWRRWVGSGK